MSNQASELLSAPWVQAQKRQALLDDANALRHQDGVYTIDQIKSQDLQFGDPVSEGYRAGLDGFNSNVPRSLIGTESGGNWQAGNDVMGAGGVRGHHGILQFGDARLRDAKKAGIIPADMTTDQFKQSKAAQVATSNWHFDNIDGRIRKNGYDKMIGQNIGGVQMSWNGMRSMAHLGGFGGLSRFIQTQGKHNPADKFGTSLSAYGKKHRN